MWGAIGDTLPLAAALALSPFAIITAIVLLLGRNGRRKTALFGVGWFVVLLVIGTVAVLIVDVAEDAAPRTTDDSVGIFQLVIGVILIVTAAIGWRRRPRPGEPIAKNKLLERIETIGVRGAFLFGLLQGIVVIKNIPLAAGAGARIGEADLAVSATILSLVVFALVASLGVLIPLLVAIVGGERLTAPLADARGWLEANMTALKVTISLIIGVFFIGQGLGIFG